MPETFRLAGADNGGLAIQPGLGPAPLASDLSFVVVLRDSDGVERFLARRLETPHP